MGIVFPVIICIRMVDCARGNDDTICNAMMVGGSGDKTFQQTFIGD